jgi:putative chitinase
MTITSQQLKQIVPAIKSDVLTVYPKHLNSILPKYSIDTPERVRCFLAQVAHESGSFNYTREIASGRAYEGRKDLGNIYPGDGVKFKGRGLIQITGRSNYEAVSKALFGDMTAVKNPEVLATPQYAVESAYWYWKVNNLNYICDQAEDWTHTSFPGTAKEHTYTRFEYLTVRINGGLNGYSERLDFYKRAKQVIA